MTKSQIKMHRDFKKSDLTAIIGCGSTPGINNIMLKHAVQFYGEIDIVGLGFAWDSNIKNLWCRFHGLTILVRQTQNIK